MDDIKDQNVDSEDKPISTAEIKHGAAGAKDNKKIHLAARQSRNRITDILHNLKNEISIRGEFEEYEDDLGTLGDNQRDGLDD